MSVGFPGGSDSKASVWNAGDLGSIPGLGRSPKGGWQPTPVFLPWTRSLVGCSPWGCKESDMTEWLSTQHIVDLQCCVSFRCTAKWFSYTYIYIFFFPDSFTLKVITEYWVELPVPYSRSLLSICFIYSSVYTSQVALVVKNFPANAGDIGDRSPAVYSS